MPTLSRRDWLRTCAAGPVGAAFVSAACAPASPPDHEHLADGASLWALGPFTRGLEGAPVLEPRADTRFACPVGARVVAWEEKDVFNPAAVVRDGAVHLIYRAEDVVGRHAGTSRIGLATSRDGLTFERRPEPVLYPDNDAFQQYEWEGGCEDPRVVETGDGGYVMTYTAYDGKVARLCVATSRDLVTWTKHGPAFAKAAGGRFHDRWSKSGAIVCEQQGSAFVAAQSGGRYWMYWGDTDIFLATSADLVNWEPVERPAAAGQQPVLASALRPRRGRFDSALVEPGPQAMITPQGILLLYNGANRQATGDPTRPEMAYSAGQALFDPADPGAVIGRAIDPFLSVETVHETTGQVQNVCFIEGLVSFNEQWFLYYGMGDSRIGVATASL